MLNGHDGTVFSSEVSDTGIVGYTKIVLFTFIGIHIALILLNQDIFSWQWTLEKLTRRGKSQRKL